jgi:hypothetical protein
MLYVWQLFLMSKPPVPLRMVWPPRVTEKLCVPTPMVKLNVWIPAGAETDLGAWLPLVTVRVAG